VATADKARISDSEVIIRGMVGKQVRGYRKALIYDDEVATGGSVVELSKHLVASEIQEITVICTHGLFTGRALERLAEIPQITEIVTTDTVPIPQEKCPANMTVLSVAPVFGEAIYRNYMRKSLSGLFAYAED
jgi:ribose-phosphate pyrophosphokinase